MKKITHYITVAAVAAGFLWLPHFSRAQSKTAKLDTSKVYSLEEVIVSASRYKKSPASVGRNVTVIDQAEIRKSMHRSVAGILSEQPSVYITGGEQTPGSLQSLYLRNTNSNQSIVMIDGVRISDPSSTGNSIDLSELSLAGVKRIEIVRGSQSTLYGSSAIGGVINIITKDKSKTGVHANVSTQQGSLGGQSYYTQNSIALRGATRSGWFANLAADQKYTPGIDATIDTTTTGGFNPQDKDGFRKFDINAKAGYEGSILNFYGSYRRIHQHRQLDQGAYSDDSNEKTTFGRNLFQYGAGADLSKKIQLSYDGAYSNLDRDLKNDSSLVAPGGPYDGSYNTTNADGTLLENNLKAVYKGNHLDLIVGASANKQTMNTRNYTYSRSQFGIYQNTTDLDSLNLHENTYNVYAHTELKGGLIARGLDKLSLVLGGRYIHHNRFGSHFTFDINPKINLGPALIYGSVTSGFNAPSLYKLYSPTKSPGYFTTRGNADLDPETSVNYEVGVKATVTDALRFDLSLYHTNITNGISYVYLWNGNTPVQQLKSADYLGDTYINLAAQHINGIDFGIQATVLSNLLLSGNISYDRSHVTFKPSDIKQANTGGNHVQLFESGIFVDKKQQRDGQTRRPQIKANVKLNYYPIPKLDVGASSQFIGNRDDIYYSANLGPIGAQGLANVDGYNITNIKLQYQLDRYINLGVRVTNVFDSRYSEINGYSTLGRGVMFKASFSI